MRACSAELSSSPDSPGLRVRSDSSRVPAGGCVGRPFGFAVTANPTPWGSTLSARASLPQVPKVTCRNGHRTPSVIHSRNNRPLAIVKFSAMLDERVRKSPAYPLWHTKPQWRLLRDRRQRWRQEFKRCTNYTRAGSE